MLHEVASKVDAIPDRLFLSLAAFKQERDQSPDSNNNIARLIIKGVEATARYQPDEHLRSGLNLTRLTAYNEFTTQTGFASAGFIADNGTVFGDNNAPQPAALRALRRRADPRVQRQRLPRLQLRLRLRRRALRLVDQQLVPEPQQDGEGARRNNLDLALYYRQPQWSATVRVLNLTDELNFVSGLAGSTNTFLQPMPGRSLMAQVDYQF